MTPPSSVDRRAPVLAHHEIDIDAPLATVWSLHTDVNSWPEWQTDVTEAHLDGGMEPGTSFDWSSYGFPVTSTVYEVTAQQRILWGGESGGIMGIHEWLFEQTPDGVHVVTNESFSGDPVERDRENLQQMLDVSLAGWLEHLKRAAEDRAVRGGAGA